MQGRIQTRILEGFDDPGFCASEWNKLLADNGGDSIYLTYEYQRTWWEVFQTGKLLLILAERDGQPIALAPFYADSRMVYFLCSDFESDCLDFVGDVSDPDVLVALLATARNSVPGFAGFVFYFVPDRSLTSKSLAHAAEKICFSCYEEDSMRVPVLDFAAARDLALKAVTKKKKSLLQHERYFRTQGSLQVSHLRKGEDILPHLDEFFEQHKARHSNLNKPSRLDSDQVANFVRRFTAEAADTEWLRFTRLDWNGKPLAFHYGYCYQKRFFWGTPSFDVQLARHSPGQVLLRQLLLAAMEEEAHTFDFGTGDHTFKTRFSSRIDLVRTLSLYPSPTRLKAKLNTTRDISAADWSSWFGQFN